MSSMERVTEPSPVHGDDDVRLFTQGITTRMIIEINDKGSVSIYPRGTTCFESYGWIPGYFQIKKITELGTYSSSIHNQIDLMRVAVHHGYWVHVFGNGYVRYHPNVWF